MSVSLADQPNDLAVALGGNRPGPAGDPRRTLIAVRPRLEQLLLRWSESGDASRLVCSWSPLLLTDPVGGPSGQPPYCNAVVLLRGVQRACNARDALQLLDELHDLECAFGRDRAREQRWGPRTLDLDLLFWGAWRLDHPRLVLPHPRLHLRPFVMEPLLAAMGESVNWNG